MNPLKKLLLIPIILVPLIISCSQDVTVPDLKGSLVGYVHTCDEYGRSLNDHSHVQITATGRGTYSTTSNAAGRFEFKGLPTGTYEVTMESPGFGTMKEFNIKHLGGEPTIMGEYFYSYELIYAYYLYQMPTSTINSLQFAGDSVIVNISFTSSYEPEYYSLRVYFSRQDGFDISNADFSEPFSLYKSGDVYKGFNSASSDFTYCTPGQHIYYRACVVEGPYGIGLYRPISSYYDYNENKTIYPNQGNASNQFSYVLPE
jgi:hypothetical protein